MKKTIRVAGLDCPVCAEALEKILRGIEGITEARVTYPLGKIELERREKKKRLAVSMNLY